MDFNSEATKWDNERRVTRAKIIADEICKSIRIKEHYSALEFGCGTGLVSFNLSEKLKHITLIDTAEGMIDLLNSKIQKSEVKNMTAIQADINRDFAFESTFDLIYTSMVLHHIIDTGTTLKNLYNLLNFNGYLCIVELVEDNGDFHKLEEDFNGHNGFNQNELKELMEKHEFKSIVKNVFYNDFKIINGSKVAYSLFIMVGKK